LEGRVEALEQRHRRLTERAADLRTRARTAERERDRLRERIRRVTGEIRELEADAAALRE
ncbi:MAG TPA: hypothetical protein VG709_01690, partial [Actinomycetota bacterium]|nr:hypothetical protein [Actinomycetota bacterium]